MSQGIRRLVFDVLKSYEPNLLELAKCLSSIKGVDGVNVYATEFDQNTENVRVVMEGENIDYKHVQTTVKDCAAEIQRIDEVVAGRRDILKELP